MGKFIILLLLAVSAALAGCSPGDPEPEATTEQSATTYIDMRPENTPVRPTNPLVIDATPDHPQGFGRKAFWFAINTDDHDAVASKLKLAKRQAANWATGMQLAFGRNIPSEYESFVFVSPPVKGWVFVLSPHFYATGDQMNPRSGQQAQAGFDLIFESLYQSFPDVQAFGSHRGVNAMKWARAIDGKVVRIFSTVESMVTANFGALTPEEHAMNLLDISGLSTDDAQDAIQANYSNYYELEDELMAAGRSRSAIEKQLAQTFKINPDGDEDLHFYLAEAWGLSPIKLETMTLNKGVGIIGELPEAMLAWPDLQPDS